MPHIYEQLLRDIRGLFRERRPKPYKAPLPTKMQHTFAKASPRGKVKVYTEEEKFLYKCRKYGCYVSQ